MAKKLDFKKFEQYLAKDKGVQKQILNIAKPAVEAGKEKLINKFMSHPVSSEISAGPDAGNSSNTLGGYGNLFSFIGFNSSDNPIEKWISFVRKAVVLEEKMDVSISGKGLIFNLKISSISDEDFRSVAPMPWEGGRSWIQAIERGISGFSYYVSLANKGRSGGGLQSNNRKKSGGSYRNVPYWSSIWKEFVKNIGKSI